MQIAIEKFRNIVLILAGLLVIIFIIMTVTGKLETINLKAILDSLMQKRI